MLGKSTAAAESQNTAAMSTLRHNLIMAHGEGGVVAVSLFAKGNTLAVLYQLLSVFEG